MKEIHIGVQPTFVIGTHFKLPYTVTENGKVLNDSNEEVRITDQKGRDVTNYNWEKVPGKYTMTVVVNS